jgi:alkanesulfonate monooxygenase SsuD/methylene tetrahydromethanopterin reductase-like flavin-dependent oxidoreductase (luciferase family)
LVKFGIGLPNSVDFDNLLKIVNECERLGFDSVWTGDHLRHSFDSWSLLAALATKTKKIRLGTLCTCVGYRYPVLLAKIIGTVDTISNGRINLGLGAGWVEEEHHAFGLNFPSPTIRIAQLREAAQIIKKLWVEDKVQFQGKHWKVEGATQVPKPLQKPHPPIWICLYGKALLKVVAEYGDGWNTGMCTPEEYKQKIELLKKYCAKIRRKTETITNSLFTSITTAANQKELEQKIKKAQPGFLRSKQIQGRYHSVFRDMPMEDYLKRYIIGTQQQCIEQIKEYTNVGVSQIIFWMSKIEDIQLLAKKVIPYFQKIN